MASQLHVRADLPTCDITTPGTTGVDIGNQHGGLVPVVSSLLRRGFDCSIILDVEKAMIHSFMSSRVIRLNESNMPWFLRSSRLCASM